MFFLNSGDTFYEDDTLKKALLFLKEDFVCGNAVLKYAGGINEWSAPEIVNTLFFCAAFFRVSSVFVYSYGTT